MSDQFDVVVIGGGPGGYNAAIRAGQLGLSSACIDKRGTFGGTCLNIGCIPSKALLFTSELFEKAEKDFPKLGIKTSGVSLDLAAMMAHKTKVVGELTRGVEFLLKKNKSEAIVGDARIVNPGQVMVTRPDGTTRTLWRRTSSSRRAPTWRRFPASRRRRNHRVVDRRARAQIRAEAIGGGGRRLYRARTRLGVAPARQRRDRRRIPRPHHAGLDGEIAKQFQRILQRQGMKFQLSTKVAGIDKKSDSLRVNVEAGAGEKQTLEADVVLVAIGRKPYTDGLGLEEVGVKRDPRGRVATDEHYKSNVAASGRSAIAAKARCWRTRRKTKRSPASRISRAARAM
jgi:dihydrolipoamide dehydrogenase